MDVPHGTAVPVQIAVNHTTGSGTPSGDVSLIANTGSSLSGQTSVGRFTLTSSGTFSGTTSSLPGGTTYNVTAHYEGDGTFAASDSASVAVTVTAESSTTTLTAQTFALSGSQLSLAPLGGGTGYGNLVYLSSTVVGASGKGTPTGSITFADASGDPPIPNNPYALNSAGNAVTPLGLFTLPVGQYSVTADYSSDASFKASSSNPALAFAISQAATATTVLPSANTISPGGSITLNASIATGTATVPSFGAAPTGTVSFFSNGTVVGTAQPVIGTAGTASFLASLLTPSSATASLTTTALPTGSDSITATYTGDSNYATSTSPAVTVTVQPDFTLPAAGLGTVVVSAPGGMGTVNLSITPGTGFNAAVSFTCTSGLPAESACLTGTIAAGQPTGTMTVTTTAPHMVMLEPSQRQNYYALWTMGSGFALGGVFLLGAPRRRRWTVLLSLMVFALLVTLPACGGGGGGGGHRDPGTPVGMTTVTVTATATGGSPSHTTTFVLNVQ